MDPSAEIGTVILNRKWRARWYWVLTAKFSQSSRISDSIICIDLQPPHFLYRLDPATKSHLLCCTVNNYLNRDRPTARFKAEDIFPCPGKPRDNPDQHAHNCRTTNQGWLVAEGNNGVEIGMLYCRCALRVRCAEQDAVNSFNFRTTATNEVLYYLIRFGILTPDMAQELKAKSSVNFIQQATETANTKCTQNNKIFPAIINQDIALLVLADSAWDNYRQRCSKAAPMKHINQCCKWIYNVSYRYVMCSLCLYATKGYPILNLKHNKILTHYHSNS